MRKIDKFEIFSIIQAIAYLFSSLMAFLCSYYGFEKLTNESQIIGLVELIGFLVIGVLLFFFALRNTFGVLKRFKNKE